MPGTSSSADRSPHIAEVAMYLMDHLANQELSLEFGQYFVRLPLTSAANITVGNALKLDWVTVLPPTEPSRL